MLRHTPRRGSPWRDVTGDLENSPSSPANSTTPCHGRSPAPGTGSEVQLRHNRDRDQGSRPPSAHASRAATRGRGRTRTGVDKWSGRAHRDRCRQWDGDARRDDRQRRAAPHRGRIRRHCRLAAVGAHRLPPGARVADPARRCPRRSVRTTQGVPDRHDLVRWARHCCAARRRTSTCSSAPECCRGSGRRSSLRAALRSCKRASERATAPRPSARGRDSGEWRARSGRSSVDGSSTDPDGAGRSSSTCPSPRWWWRAHACRYRRAVIRTLRAASTSSALDSPWSPSVPRPGRSPNRGLGAGPTRRSSPRERSRRWVSSRSFTACCTRPTRSSRPNSSTAESSRSRTW